MNNNNKGHCVQEMELPEIEDSAETMVASTHKLVDCKSLGAHMRQFRVMQVAKEKTKDRYGPATRYEDGTAEMEFHLPEEEPVVLDGVELWSYAPVVWPKTYDFF